MELRHLAITLVGGEASRSQLGSMEPYISALGRIAELDGKRLRKYWRGSHRSGQAASFDYCGLHCGANGGNACVDYDNLPGVWRRASRPRIAGKLADA